MELLNLSPGVTLLKIVDNEDNNYSGQVLLI